MNEDLELATVSCEEYAAINSCDALRIIDNVQPEYPTTVQELVDSEWYAKINTAIRSFRLKDDAEDLLQDVLLHFAKIDYLGSWDETKGSFSNWIYTGVNNLLKKKWAHEHTVAGAALVVAVELDKPISFDEGSVTTFGDMIPDITNNSFEANDILDAMTTLLSAPEYKANSSNGIYSRDMKTVLSLLRQGDDVKDIATKFNTSVQFVYNLIKKMQSVTQQLVA